MPPPLAGIKVLDFSHALAGPFCTLLLSDYGATVYKLESPDGGDIGRGWAPPFTGGQASYFLGLNRGKQGISVNLDAKSKTLGTGNSEASCSTGTDVGFNTGSNGGNVPLNKLYVTLLNGLGATDNGAPITRFGVADSGNLDAGITNPGEFPALKA